MIGTRHLNGGNGYVVPLLAGILPTSGSKAVPGSSVIARSLVARLRSRAQPHLFSAKCNLLAFPTALALDKNFGITFSLWDQLFGTAHFPKEDEWPEVGIAGHSPPATLGAFVCYPLNFLAGSRRITGAMKNTQAELLR